MSAYCFITYTFFFSMWCLKLKTSSWDPEEKMFGYFDFKKCKHCKFLFRIIIYLFIYYFLSLEVEIRSYLITRWYDPMNPMKGNIFPRQPCWILFNFSSCYFSGLPNLEEPVSTHWIGYKYEPVDSDPSLSKATDMLKNVIVPECFHL